MGACFCGKGKEHKSTQVGRFMSYFLSSPGSQCWAWCIICSMTAFMNEYSKFARLLKPYRHVCWVTCLPTPTPLEPHRPMPALPDGSCLASLCTGPWLCLQGLKIHHPVAGSKKIHLFYLDSLCIHFLKCFKMDPYEVPTMCTCGARPWD